MTKKVLIISYYFNQIEQIGSIRLRGLAKYLPEFGWEPTVITIKYPDKTDSAFRTIETEYSDLMTNWKSKLGFNLDEGVQDQLNVNSKQKSKGVLDYLINKWLEIFAYPDPEKNWYKPAVKAGSEILEDEDFDLILSSSGPATCHLIAHELKNRYKIPWVADLRDLWTQNHDYAYSSLRRFRETRLEKKTFSTADALITVSSPKTERLARLHNHENVYAIPNGFDPDLISTEKELDKNMSIVYTGRIYPGKMDPEPLFKALNEIITDQEIDEKDVTVDLYGINVDVLNDSVEKYNLKNIVNIKGLIPREKVIEKQRKAQLLLLLNWNDPNEKGVYTGKVFEYLSAKRPIIAIGGYGDGVVDELLEDTDAGTSLREVNDIKNVINQYYTQFKANGKVQYKGIPEEINKFSHVGMAEKFSEVFSNVENNITKE